jgi:hypothetical protein
MLYLLVQVNDGDECIIPERVTSIESTNNHFYDLFDTVTLGQCEDREVRVFIRREDTDKWREVDNGLKGDLKMLKILGFTQVKFCLIIKDEPDTPTKNKPNALNILMNSSRQPLLPKRCNEHNNCNRLYNEIIELFQVQSVGWIGGSHNTIGKTFVNCVTNAIWYIDPHLSTLRTHSYYLPALFTQLKTYQEGGTYNTYYYTSHHKKHPLSQQKLLNLANSLELSISQPWANSDIWNQVMPEIFSLIEILKSYAENLNNLDKLMIGEKM